VTRLPRILAVVVLVLAGVLYTRHLDAWRIDDDEEGYLYAAWRIDEGELPYGDFLTPQLPGFLYPGAAVVRLAGAGDATAPRAWSVLLVLVAAAALFVAGSDLIGPWGGLLAMTVFLLSEDVYLIATAFRPEPTMLAATVAALAFFVRGELRERPGLFVVASLLFGVGLLAKLFSALPWIAAGVYLTCDGLC
jgi:4-amino-4-deoxy-L-arabinose transferase-like glycosyltransferase